MYLVLWRLGLRAAHHVQPVLSVFAGKCRDSELIRSHGAGQVVIGVASRSCFGFFSFCWSPLSISIIPSFPIEGLFDLCLCPFFLNPCFLPSFLDPGFGPGFPLRAFFEGGPFNASLLGGSAIDGHVRTLWPIAKQCPHCVAFLLLPDALLLSFGFSLSCIGSGSADIIDDEYSAISGCGDHDILTSLYPRPSMERCNQIFLDRSKIIEMGRGLRNSPIAEMIRKSVKGRVVVLASTLPPTFLSPSALAANHYLSEKRMLIIFNSENCILIFSHVQHRHNAPK